MQTKTDSLAMHPRSVAAAANDEFVVTSLVEAPSRKDTSGWDPYEVWRTRVKVMKDSLKGDIAVSQ